MRKIALLIAALGLAVTPLLFAAPAHAQATRTWVSGVGDDANPCSRTAPCKTFAGAISKTAVGGEINCIDPGGFGAVTITKSLTIDCHEVYSSILVAGTNGINIPFDSFADAFKTVRLRNINFNGVGGSGTSGLSGVSITGTSNTAGSRVVIEDCMIDGFTGSPGRGINDTRSNGGKLEVNNTTIRDVGGSAIVILPTSGSTRIDASLFNVRLYNATNGGLAVNSGAKATITNSVISGNGTGLDSEGAGTEIHVNEVQVSSNGTGIFTGSGGVVHVNSSDVSFNTTCNNGTVNTFGNNRFVGNGSACTLTANSPGLQ
jgi:hypothetical protein